MPKVQVLLATLNGERFLADQLASLARQSWPKIDLLVSDDGSTDGTLSLIADYACRWNKGALEVVAGPHTGSPADNFRSLVLRSNGQASYVAYCDQDDIWLPDKLSRAIEAIGKVTDGVPALHCSPTSLVDEHGRILGRSKLFRKEPHFRNALVQSLAGGNTMVMNRTAFQLVKRSCELSGFLMHDWWTYLIVSGAGGFISYDATVETHYRQHSQNTIGSNLGWRARWRRVRSILRGDWRQWNDMNERGLLACRDLLLPEAQREFELFRRARRGTPWGRVIRLAQSGVYRQTFSGQAALYLATLLGRI